MTSGKTLWIAGTSVCSWGPMGPTVTNPIIKHNFTVRGSQSSIKERGLNHGLPLGLQKFGD